MLDKETLEKMGISFGGSNATITMNPGGFIHYKGSDGKEIKIEACDIETIEIKGDK